MAFVPYNVADSVFGAAQIYHQSRQNNFNVNGNDGAGGTSSGAGQNATSNNSNLGANTVGASSGYNVGFNPSVNSVMGLLSGNPISMAIAGYNMLSFTPKTDEQMIAEDQANIDAGMTVDFGGLQVSSPSGFSAQAAGYSSAADTNASNADASGYSNAGGYADGDF